jgi:glucose/arabinose dehydrogenase
MALRGGYLYVANTDSVYRYPFRVGQTSIRSKPEKIVTGIPSKGYRQHWTRNILFTPDGKQFYLTVGSETNKSPEKPPRATILRFNADGSGRTVFATGLRNPVGLGFEPDSGMLWASNIERDYMGDDMVPDFVTSVEQNDFFGWPWFYIGRNLDPALAKMNPPNKSVTVPDVLVSAHAVPLGIAFYQGQQFPDEYRGDLFITMRGSRNRSKMSGYRVGRVRFADGRPISGVEDFITGWSPDTSKREVFGRPVGLAVCPDGSMLIADEAAHKILRVTYEKAPS